MGMKVGPRMTDASQSNRGTRGHHTPYGICQIHHRGMLLSRVMGIVRLRFIFDLLMISIVAVIGITIGL